MNDYEIARALFKKHSKAEKQAHEALLKAVGPKFFHPDGCRMDDIQLYLLKDELRAAFDVKCRERLEELRGITIQARIK